jgi:hypothetical protein
VSAPPHVIADSPPDDGQAWECQCARCGSSVDDGEDCWRCAGDGTLGSACMDDLCHGGVCIHGDDDEIPCDICDGRGRFPPRCLSDSAWCEAHPLPGRETTPRGSLEWFVVERASSAEEGTP